MMTITELADQARAAAESVLKRHQKLASLDLYRVLAQCMGVCDAVERTNHGEMELRALIAADKGRKNRSYAEAGSDRFTLACRYVFSGDESHANMSRYAHALREAWRIGLHGAILFEHLRDQGGVNALYLRRPSDRATVEAKLIRLDRAMVFPKSGSFTLTLQRRPDNVFEVLEKTDV